MAVLYDEGCGEVEDSIVATLPWGQQALVH
jgi:hypothetical protein